MASSIWSSSDAAANGMTLSNGGLTVTPSGASAWQSIRGSISKSSGKLYVEWVTSVAVTDQNMFFGMADASFAANNYLGSSGVSCALAPAAYNSFTSGFTVNHQFTSFLPAANDVIGLAIDFTAGLIWFSHNNVWVGANPSTGSGSAFTISSPATGVALFPALSFDSGGNGVWTLHATAASQKYAPPTGFAAWDPVSIGGSLYGKGLWGKSLYSQSIAATGALAVTQDAQTFSGVGKVTVGGALNVTQANQALVAAGSTTIKGTLVVAQAAQTLIGSGTVVSPGIINGTLVLTQANQTLVGAGTAPLVVTGALNVTQANQTLVAAAQGIVGGVLGIVQADQILVGAAASSVRGVLALSQDDQALSAAGVVEQPPTSATLVVTQDDQTLGSSGLILGWGPSEPCPPPLWDASEPCPPSMWTPVPPPNWELPGVSQGWGVGAYGVSVYQPSSSSPWLPPDQSVTPPTWTSSAPPVDVDWQETEPCNGG